MSKHLLSPDLLKGPISWMARNPVAANLGMFITLLVGIIAGTTLKQEVFPEFQLDFVQVSVPYPGASPTEVEQGIVLAVEEKVRSVDGVKRITSTSSEGVGSVSVELLLGADPDKALADVKNQIDQIQTFPEDSEDPTVQLLTNRQQVISLIAAGDMNMSTLYELGEKIRSDLLQRDGITQVEVFGIPPVEISVEVDRDTLQSLGMSLDDISREVAGASIELPGGGVDTPGGEVLVRMADRKRDGQSFEDVVLRGTADGGLIRLSDVATISDGFEDNDQATFLNGRPAVSVTAYRVGDETPTEVADIVKAYAEELRAELPPGVDVMTWNDDSELLKGRIDLLLRNARTGLVLVLFILAMFLDLRLAFWVGLGIPVSFLGAIALMPGLDVSINMISLFALIITLGMVVDDAIVVGENIHEKTEKGMDPLKAAIQGAKEMAVPITFAILTTFAAFAPMLAVPGFSGKIFGIIPLVVASVLTFSLLESFFILPAHLSHGQSDTGLSAKLASMTAPVRDRVAGALDDFINGPYARTLDVALANKFATLATAVALFIVAIGLRSSGIVGFSFFPKLESDLVTVSARLPYGAPIERTNEVQRTLLSALDETIEENGWQEDVKGTLTRLGEGPPDRRGPSATGSHLVTLEVNLVGSEERDFTAAAFSAAWKENVPLIAGLEALTYSSSAGPSGGKAVDVMLSHDDTDVLAAASYEMADILHTYPQLYNIDNSYSAGKPQLDFTLLPQARTLGLTATDVARQLRASFYGAEAIREQRGRSEMKVMVRLPEYQRTSEYDVANLRVKTPTGALVPLNSIATFHRGSAPTSIVREDGRRIINVTGELAPGFTTSEAVIDALTKPKTTEGGEPQPSILENLTAKYPGLTAEMAGEQRDQAESLGSLGRNYMIALFAIYALLAIPFKSYVQPIVIMSVIPFGFVGAVMGHLMLGYDLSIISMMGIIAASGVVVNDSLVLVDAANNFQRQEGMGPLDAIVAAGKRRFRPILLTSLTTFFGLLPMIAETSIQAKFLIPMAISLGFGVLFATFIVLLVVPALFMIIADVQDWWMRRGGKMPDEVVVISVQAK